MYLFSYLSLLLLCGDEAENCTTLEFSSGADRDAKAAVFFRDFSTTSQPVFVFSIVIAFVFAFAFAFVFVLCF